MSNEELIKRIEVLEEQNKEFSKNLAELNNLIKNLLILKNNFIEEKINEIQLKKAGIENTELVKKTTTAKKETVKKETAKKEEPKKNVMTLADRKKLFENIYSKHKDKFEKFDGDSASDVFDKHKTNKEFRLLFTKFSK